MSILWTLFGIACSSNAMSDSVFLTARDEKQGSEYKVGLGGGCVNELSVEHGFVKVLARRGVASAADAAETGDSACKAVIGMFSAVLVLLLDLRMLGL